MITLLKKTTPLVLLVIVLAFVVAQYQQTTHTQKTVSAQSLLLPMTHGWAIQQPAKQDLQLGLLGIKEKQIDNKF
jgi:hypothetical protein